MYYEITGVNRLTGQREVISSRLTLGQAMNLLNREVYKKKRAWLRLKWREVQETQLNLFTYETD